MTDESCGLLGRYLRYGHHESLVTTVDIDGRPNVAPMGVELAGNNVILKPYITTRTYANIVRSGEAVVNVTSDALLYYYALFNPERIKYGKSRLVKPPRVLGNVDLYAECAVVEVTPRGDVGLTSLRPLCCHRGSGSKLAFSRANSSVIEALVHYTKLLHFVNTGNLEEARLRYSAIEAARGIVLKVGNEVLRKVIDDIWVKSLQLVGGHSPLEGF